MQTLRPEDTLAQGMDRFLLSEHDELPVVDANARLVGVVSRRDVLRVYSTELLRQEHLGTASVPRNPRRRRRIVRLAPGLILARVTTPAWLAGRSLRAANLRATHNLTVVAVLRGGVGDEELAQPDEALDARDVLLVVGHPRDVTELRWPSHSPDQRRQER